MSSPEFLMLFRGAGWPESLPAGEVAEIMARTNAWFDRLTAEGIVRAAQPLEREGRLISSRDGTISDGPFVETKESVGGYVLITAADFDDAMEIARQNPMIPHGLVVEIRAIAETCPSVKAAMTRPAAAHV